MKKLLLTAAVTLFAAINMFAQGQGIVTFNTTGVTNTIRVKDSTGQNAGAGYAVALYWGSATETDDRNLTQIGASTPLLTGSAAGTYFGSGRTITTPGSALNGPVLSFQVRGWATAAGSTYEQALAAGGATGKNGIFQLKTKDPLNNLETSPNIWGSPGYQGFTIAVPEPSVIGLGILGVGALLMLRRRK